MAIEQRFDYRAIFLALVAAFVVSLILAVLAGLFLGFFGSAFIDDSESTSVFFDLGFLTVFVLPAYICCGYLAARMAASRHLVHATIAGAVFLLANIAMAFPSDPDDPIAWTDAFCYLSAIPLAVLGGKLALWGWLRDGG